MKFVLQLTIGLLLFNSMLLIFSPFFSPYGSTASSGAENITQNEEYEKYNTISNIISWDITQITIMGLSVTISVGLAWLIKSPNILAAGLFGGLVANLYLAPAKIIYSMTDNIIITGFLSIIAIMTGILVAISVMDVLSGGRLET